MDTLDRLKRDVENCFDKYEDDYGLHHDDIQWMIQTIKDQQETLRNPPIKILKEKKNRPTVIEYNGGVYILRHENTFSRGKFYEDRK